MIRLSLIPLVLFAAATTSAQEIPSMPVEATRIAPPILSATQTTVRSWITNQSAAARKARIEASALDASLRTAIPTRFAGQKISSGATDALVLLVLIETAQATAADIKALLAQMEQTRAQRDALREYVAKLEAAADTTGLDAARDKLDSIEELSKDQALRLQELLDRLERYHRALSELLKKTATVQSTILQNLK